MSPYLIRTLVMFQAWLTDPTTTRDERGSVSTTVSGSGTLENVDEDEIKIPGGVVIDEIPVKANDKVKAGDVIAAPVQVDGKYGLAVDGVTWETLYDNANQVVLSADGGATAAVVQVKPLGQADIETFPLDRAVDVYQRLREGKIHGRAVLRP